MYVRSEASATSVLKIKASEDHLRQRLEVREVRRAAEKELSACARLVKHPVSKKAHCRLCSMPPTCKQVLRSGRSKRE